MFRSLTQIGFGGALVALGLIAGRLTSPGGTTAAPAEEAHDHASDVPALHAETLESIGVETGVVQPREYTRYRRVQAAVVDRPVNRQPAVAPLGGIVTRVLVEAGDVVKAGEPLVTLARDPIARPMPELTADILTPVSERVHESLSRLRTAVGQVSIVQQELERVTKYTATNTTDGLPLLPRKTEIDLRYDLARANQEVTNARMELIRHGLSDAELDRVLAGGDPPTNQHLWRRALEQHGLWTDVAASLYAALPETERVMPWSVAAIGELSAAGLATPDLLKTLEDVPAAAKHFVEVAGLLLKGTPVATVRLLAENGALEPEIVVRARASSGADWDVDAVAVRVGQRAEAGEVLVELHDASRMWLRLQPIGQEVQFVATALESRTKLTAQPLVAGSGPDLKNLVIDRMETLADDAERGGIAYIVAKNAPLSCDAPVQTRSWGLRVGLRYLVRVPVAVLEDRFVLPIDAVTSEGPDRIVFVLDGLSYRPTRVVVEYADDEVAVLPNDGCIYPGDTIVLRHAFELGLALRVGHGGPEVHSSCGHVH